MEDRQEKVSKYIYSSVNSHNGHLQSEIRMLEERLKNLEYLKQTYERNAREKTLDLDSLNRENFELRSQLQSSLKTIDDLSKLRSSNESNLISIIEELRTNKYLLEQELGSKSAQTLDLESRLQEQYEKNLKLIDENQVLRRDLKDRERVYNENVDELEGKLKRISVSQRITEERVNKMVKDAAPGSLKKNKKAGTGGGGGSNAKLKEMYRKEARVGKSFKDESGEVYRKRPVGIEERLLMSEKKIKDLESALASTTKAEFAAPVSLQASTKLRSASQSIRNKKPRYL